MTAMVRAGAADVASAAGTRIVDRPISIVPPHDLDAEAAVISAVLLDAAALSRIEDFLRPEHFYSGAHRVIYEASIAVKATGVPIDAITVLSRLKETGRLQQVGGSPYITEILDSTPAPGNVRAHAATVFERWRVRQTILVCERASAYGHGVTDAQAYVDSVIRGLSDLSRQRPGEKVENNFETLRRIVRELQEGADTKAPTTKGRGIPTGVKPYDENLLGLFAGQKTTIVAPPRVGKTALALQIAVNVAQLGIGVAFWSTEMLRDEIGDRQLAYLASVDSRRILQAKQKPTLTAEEWRRIAMTMSEIEKVRYALHVFDDPDPSVDDIAARTKALHEQSMALNGVPLGLVIVDYVQKLKVARCVQGRQKHEQVAYSTERLKILAGELKLPVIELAQEKNREVDKAKGCRARPELGMAADCFQIERSANNVVYLWRPRERDGRHVKAVVVKQRGGDESEFDLQFEKEFSRFSERPFSADHSDHEPRSSRRSRADQEPPPGRFDDEDDGSSTLTGGM